MVLRDECRKTFRNKKASLIEKILRNGLDEQNFEMKLATLENETNVDNRRIKRTSGAFKSLGPGALDFLRACARRI